MLTLCRSHAVPFNVFIHFSYKYFHKKELHEYVNQSFEITVLKPTHFDIKNSQNRLILKNGFWLEGLDT